jgi:HSP20 family molecular chaperone IbpA
MTAQTATSMQPVKTSAVSKQAESENVLDRFEQVYNSIAKRAFKIFDNNGRWFGNDLSDWLKAESELLHPVHLEISETEHALNVRAEVPGFTPKELDIHVDGKRLTIAGKHESKEEGTKGETVYSERCAKEIFRTVVLPSDVDGEKVNATLKDGVLNIELPKAPQAKTIHIAPKSAS